MQNRRYIEFLNTLHNVGAKNENAIAEAAQSNEFFKKIMVKRPITQFIIKSLKEASSRIILITGHAGDGKTSLLLQVLQELNLLNGNLKPEYRVKLENGNECICIKDFSEFSFEKRKEILSNCLKESSQGKFIILVANTGPLLNTFADVLSENNEEVQIQLINAIDINDGKVNDIAGYNIQVINVASIDNSSFAEPFLSNIISQEMFNSCELCSKNNHCPILFNKMLVSTHSAKVFEFLRNHFIWQQEHGRRLTIRQIISQITFALTAGLDCGNVKLVQNKEAYFFRYLFSNTLFGYLGIKQNKDSLRIQAIEDISYNNYDSKSLICDEDIFILKDYSSFEQKLQNIIIELKNNYIQKNIFDWQKAVRRMYILFNVETDDKKNIELINNVFSRKFTRYLELRKDKAPNSDDKNLIRMAFSILFVGYTNTKNDQLAITMKRENGIEQSVQMLCGKFKNKEINLSQRDSVSCSFGEEQKKELYLKIRDKEIKYPITLPLINYFDEIKRGIVSTNIDPQLTHGIDSIKAQMLSLCKFDSDDNEIQILLLNNFGLNDITLIEEDGNWILD